MDDLRVIDVTALLFVPISACGCVRPEADAVGSKASDDR
jgi:hypothetical protein